MLLRSRLGWLPLSLALLCSASPLRAEPLDVELGSIDIRFASPAFWISRDGSRVVFQDATELRDVLSVPIEGGDAANLTPPETEAPGLVEIALDGSRALMTARVPGSLVEIFSAPLIGGEVTKVNHPLAAGLSAFPGPITPDSTRVIYGTRAGCSFVSASYLYCRGPVELFVAPLDGGAPTPLDMPDLPLDGPVNLGLFSVSPDSDVGVSVMFERLPPDVNEDPDPVVLFSTPLAGGLSTVLHKGGWFDEPFQFTSDGRRVVYNRVGELYSVSVAGGPAVKLNPPLVGPHTVVPFSITPDGSRVIYPARQDRPVSELYSVPSVGGSTTKLSHPDGRYEAHPWQMAPDGERVVFVQYVGPDEALWSVPVQGGTPTRLSPPRAPQIPGDLDFSIEAIRLSPHGDHVVYVANQDMDDRWDLYSVPIDGGPATRLGGPLVRQNRFWENVESRYRITPDGSHVVFGTDSTDSFPGGFFELHAVPIGGGVVTKLSEPMEEGEQISPFWMEVSADSRHVVYPVTRPGTFIRELHSARLPPEIRIDIRPRKAQNKLRPGPNASISVAILGSDEVNVADVDLATLLFGPSGAVPERKAKRVDVDGDGFRDLVTRYRQYEAGIAHGDTEACLTGSYDGFEFSSCDAIVTKER